MSFSDLSEMSDADFKSLTLHELSGITATGSNEQAKALPKHDEFYIKDFVTLKVDKTLFRVEGCVLAASSVIRAAMEKEPLSSDGNDCILISNISALQMECLLEFLYYPAVKSFSMAIYRVIAAFQIAKMLGFEEKHQFLEEILETNIIPGRFDLLPRIIFARQCRVVEWLRRAYSEIASRAEGPSEQEAKELGWEKTLALGRVREKLSALRVTRTSAASQGDGESPAPVDQELWKEASEMVGSEACLNEPDFEPVAPPSFSRTTTSGGSRHAMFYLNRLSLVTLKVQGVLFRIPIRRAEGIKVINDLTTATTRDHPVSTDDNPLEIGDEALKIQEFESFLRIIYASHGEKLVSKLSFSELARGLRAAVLLKHETARNYILDTVKTDFKEQDPIDLIVFANEYNLESWIPAQYTRLAKRTAVITEGEMRRLGYKAVSEIARRREAEALQRGRKKGISDTVEEFKRREAARSPSVAKPRR